MRLFFSIPLGLLGVFLISLTIDNFGKTGNIVMHIIGVGIILFAGVISQKGKKEKKQHS